MNRNHKGEPMKTLIVYVSVHHKNTEKIAKAMADELRAELVNPHHVDIHTLADYDVIGFGSGIYFGKHHETLLALVDELPVLTKKAFIFSTSGLKDSLLKLLYGGDFHKALRTKLVEKGLTIIGEFSCRGFDTFGPLKVIGGINRGRPNEKDIESAKDFVQSLLQKAVA